MPAAGLTLISQKPKRVTDVLSLQGIPPQSPCEQMIELFNGGNYSAISCRLGTFTEQSARIILNIHKLRDIKSRVKEEQQWIKNGITLPHPSCSYSEEDITKYATLIFHNPDGSSVLSHNRYILASDLATVARKVWISHAILNGVTDILQMNTKHTSVFMLNDVLMNGSDYLQEYLSGNLSRSTKGIVFVVNVGRTKSNQVYISSMNRPGCHWTLLYIDLKSNKWYYCDTSCWGSPSNLRGVVSPVVTAIYQVVRTFPKPFAGIVEGHVEANVSTGSTAHTCSTRCLRNIPLQTCMNVCGAAVAILAAIAAKAPRLWKNVFLKRKGVLPDSLKWLMSPTVHSDFLRSTMISWLVTGSVDISFLGVPEGHVVHVKRNTRTSDGWSDGADKRYVHVKERETVEIVDSDDGSCGNANNTQVKGDGEDDDVLVKVREAVEIVDSDHGSCENANDGQAEGCAEGGGVHVKERETVDPGESDDESWENASDGQVEGDGEDADVLIKVREAVEIVDSDHGSCENANDGQAEGCAEGGGVHVKERETVDPGESDEGSWENASDGQVEGDGEDADILVKVREAVEIVDFDHGSCENANDGQAEDCAEGGGVHVKERETVDPGESDDGSWENASDGQVEGDVVHVMERDTVKPENSNDRSWKNASDGQVEGDFVHVKERNTVEPENSDGENFEDQRIFFVGKTISNLDELEKLKAKYEDRNFCELWKRDVRTLQAAARRVPKRVEIAKPSLKYYSLKLVCKFGGKPRKRTQRIRNTKTFRQECPFEVYLILSQDGQHLEVIRIKEVHNHVANKTIYDHLPRQRASRVTQTADNIAEAIKLHANPKILQQKVEETTGRKVTLKDISNIKQRSKQDINNNNLEDVIQHLKNQPGSITEVIVDKDNNFKGIFYQDKYMQNLFEKFPEMILVDATYKLLDLRMTVYLLMCIDGDGLSEIVAMFTLAEETKDVIQASVEIFKKHNPSCYKTKVIMSDKDFTERDAFTSCFPGAALNICLYHILRSFRREVTCEKLGISTAERLRALEILSRMAHSKTATEYDKALDELKSSNMKRVAEYVLQNWEPIKDQWVACFKDKAFNLGETTNNRLESTFSKIKSVCSRYASLMQFFSEFLCVLKCLREQRNHHYLMAITRKKTEFENLDKDLQLFCNFLTPYAFKFVREQLQSSSQVKVLNQLNSNEFSLSEAKNVQEPHIATPSLCDCSFSSSMGLPCKHIFKVRSLLNIPAFSQSLVHERWTMEYYQSVERFPSMISDQEEDCPYTGDHATATFHVTALQEQQGEKSRTLSQAQKFRKGLQIAQTMASLLSEGGMATFRARYDVLQSIIRSWQTGREVSVCEVEDGNQGNSKQCEDIEAMVDQKDPATNVGISEDKGTKIENVEKGQTHLDSGARGETSTTTEGTKELDEEELPWNDNKHGQKAEKNRDELEDSRTLISTVKMSPTMLKRGQPKGAEVTVIGLPKAKKKKEKNDKIKPFGKLTPVEKETTILRSLTSDLAASEASQGKRILRSDDLISLHEIPDSIQDKESLDIYRVQKYFGKEAWLEVLDLIRKKEEIGWCCAVCRKVINDECEDSIACDRCLLWSHFNCTSLNKKPKNRNWFCKSCKLKFS